ncbi:MAG: hypothetical protein ACAH59_12735 [Pseudobdellovibrionaceae bacterium]
MKIIFSLIGLLSISLSAGAAVSPAAKKPFKTSAILRGTGAIHGGMAGTGFSLLGIKSQVAKSKKLERLTVGMGDAKFNSYSGAPGYFHIENAPGSKRVVINFMQTLNSKFDEKAVQKVFAQSPFVQKSEMVFDSQTQTTSLILNLKKPVSVRAIPVNGKQKQMAQLKVDLFEDSLLKRKKM